MSKRLTNLERLNLIIDFIKTNNQNWKDLWNIYKNLKDKHSNMVIHCNSDEVIFNGE